jgi:hypothetical protein
MSRVDLKKLDKDMQAIIKLVLAKDSVPRKIMEAKRANNSIPWDAEADAKNFDDHVGEFADLFDQAVKIVTTKK